MKKDLKDLFVEYNSLPMSSQRTKIGRSIRNGKKRVVERKDYVEILHILRFMGDYDKDRLFLDLLKVHPGSSLFVLAFADSNMHSYDCASEMAKKEYDGDENGLKKDVELLFDNQLCIFLGQYKKGEDLDYVRELVDGATWLESYKLVVQSSFQV